MTGFRSLLAILNLLLVAQYFSAQEFHPIGTNQRYYSALVKILARPGINRPQAIPQQIRTTGSRAGAKASFSTFNPTPLAGIAFIDTSRNLVTEQAGYNVWMGGDILQTSDGNIVVPGFHQQTTSPFYAFPGLMKYDINGNVLWYKTFDAANVYPANNASAYKAFQLNDGNLLLAGEVFIPEPVNGREEIILWKLTPNGNVIWVQTDSGSNWTQYSGSLNFTGMAQDPAGNIYLSANDYTFDAITTHHLVLKMDPAGNVIWDKGFTVRGSQCFGMLYLGGELSVYGTNGFVYVPNGNGFQTSYLWNIKLNPATVDTLRIKCWYADYGPNSGWNSILGGGSVQLLANGNMAIAGPALSNSRVGLRTMFTASRPSSAWGSIFSLER